MADLVCFRALGRLELTRGTRPLALIRRRKRLGLFTFLALSRSAFQRRDVVQAIFWPDSDQDRARHSLNESLSLLRQELGSDIVVTRGTDEIGIAVGGIWSDVVAFSELIAARAYAKALDLYGGDLLPGFFIADAPQFERWLDEERVRLRRAATEAARTRAELALEQGEAIEAAEWARRAAGMAYDDELVVRRSIQVLDQVGDRAGAVEAFERFSRYLRSEYDAEPAPETERLIVEIRRRVEPGLLVEPIEQQELHRPTEKHENGRIHRPAVVTAPVIPRRDVPAPERQASPEVVAYGVGSLPVDVRPRSRLTRHLVAATVIVGTCVTGGIGLTRVAGTDDSLTGSGYERPNIVILPFQPLGTRPELEYIAPAITAALTEQLAEVDAVELIAGEAQTRAAWAAAGSIGGQESAETFLVRGYVLPSERRIRVGISVIDAGTGAVLRTATVERAVEDIFALIDQAARDLGELLRSELGHEIRIRRWRAATANTRAWELQKRAEAERQRAKKLEDDGSFVAAAAKLKEADSLLALAEAEEPSWNAPTIWRARVASDAAWLAFPPPISDTMEARHWIGVGIAHADRALRQESAQPLALELRGTLRYWSSLIAPDTPADAAAALDSAQADLERAVSIDPDLARAWSLLSAILYSRGEFSRAYVASHHAYTTDAYLEARDETLVRLAMTAYEIGNDSTAWQWCSAVDATTPQGAYCRLTLMAWVDLPRNGVPNPPWPVLDRLSGAGATAENLPPALAMLAATVLARSELPDSARAVIARVRRRDPTSQELDLLEAGARLALGETHNAAALLRRFVLANPAHNVGTVASRRFAPLRPLLQDLWSPELSSSRSGR